MLGEKRPFFFLSDGKGGLEKQDNLRHKWVAFKRSPQFSSREFFFWLYASHEWD